jgi:hypothetical protein
MNHEGTQVSVTSLADAKQANLSPGPKLRRDESKPRSKFPP